MKKFVKRTRFFTVPLMIISLVASGFSGFAIPINKAKAALSQTGPVVAGVGFPAWYKDSNGVALDLMEAADGFGISAPVEVGNAFSETIGFGAEGFWWSADSSINSGGVSARLMLALEAAFAGESAIDGEQSAFGRARYRIDGLTPDATYTIKHPYGTVTEVADAGGSINVTDDIGCFAVAGASSCDPNNPLGSPLPQFNFSAALSSQIGPFLTWDTFDPLTVTDANLNNPANPTRKYVGNPNIPHTVTGSPVAQNFFRIEGENVGGVGVNFVETDLFSVTGRLAVIVPEAPVIDAIANKTVQVSTPISFTATASDANLDPITFSVTPVTAIGNEAFATINPSTGVFSWTPTTAGTSTFTIGASDGTVTTNTTVTIEVTTGAPVLTSILVTPNTANIIEGANRQLTVVALDASGAQIVPTPAIAWTSSDETLATVNATTGLVTAVAQGTATITATAVGVPVSTAIITITPSTLFGGGLSASIPVDPVTGFPRYYKNRNGFALELMKADDVFGISAPVEVGNAFSETIGFGAEGFWSSADAILATTGAKPAVLVQAVEAAFAGESAVDGQQSAFGRIRIRVDINEPGTYTVTYPYGQKTYTVTADQIGAGYEINDTNDIGCFAIQGVSSCDPNNVLGSPQTAFNFNAVGLSEVGPFLSWDTFNPTANDPLLTNPANPNRKYVGDARVAHAIQGSPTGNNFFRIESATPGVDLDPAAGVQSFVQTNLFNVSGMLADVTAPVITVNGANPDSVVQGVQYVDPGVTVVDDVDGTITTGIVVTGLPTILDPVGAYVVTYSVSDSSGNSAVATRIVNVTPAPVADSVVIATATPTIATGATQQLSVAVLDATLAPITPTPAITFTSADPLIATVDANGVVTAVAPGGPVNITATVTDVPTATETVAITVADTVPSIVATTVNVVTAATTIETGVTQQLVAAVLDQNGAIITPTPAVTFVSDTPAVATVNETTGVVTAVATGTATITATSAGVPVDTVAITVADPTPTPTPTILNIETPAPIIVPTATQQLSAAVIDQAGVAIIPAPAITFVSDTPAVATVNETTGVVTAVAPGTATITATSAGVPVDTVVVTVESPVPTVVATTVSVEIATQTVAPGTTQQLSVAVLDQNGATMVSPPAVTLVSSDPTVATVNETTGVVTAVSTGISIITATVGGHTDTVTVLVPDTTAPIITITDPNPATVIVNTTYVDAGATATDDLDGSRTANIVTTGLPIDTTTVGAHVVTYTVADMAGNTAVATRIVNVISAPVVPPTITTIEVITPNPTITVGTPQTFNADAHDQNGVKLDDQPDFVWASSNPTVGTINATTGLFTPHSAGTTEITATEPGSGLVRTITVTVAAADVVVPPVENPTLTPIYRLYNKVTGAHVYTRGEAERDRILGTWSVFEFTDGVPAFSASLTAQAGQTPIYRLYNKVTGVQVYTRGEAERDRILGTWSAFEFTDGVPAFYASLTSQAGLTPIYRLYNTQTDAHLYAKGDIDKTHVLTHFPAFEFTDGVPAFFATIN